MANVVRSSYQKVRTVVHALPSPVKLPGEFRSPTFQSKVVELVAHQLPYGAVTSYPSRSAITSATGQSVRTPAKKQMRSTSRSYSRRRYYYGKKRKY